MLWHAKTSGAPRGADGVHSETRKLAVESNAAMTNDLQTATDEALRNLSALAETVNEAIGRRLNS